MTDQVVVGGQLGNYLIDSVIGRGGMSVVYRAKHSRLGMAVALKVLAPELSADDTFRERFLREAQMAAAVDHPNVIPIHDMGVHDSSLYIVMRYVAGGDLKTLLAKAGPLDPVQAIALLMPAALALDAAHTHGLIHRDVKPANILLQRSGGGDVDHVYLTDFGIAKSASSTTRLTSTGAFIGTIEYMAPEQMDGRDISARTDVYALGATFYECVTGRVPYQRELSEGVRFPSGPPESVAARHPGLPRGAGRSDRQGARAGPRRSLCDVRAVSACVPKRAGSPDARRRSGRRGDRGDPAVLRRASCQPDRGRDGSGARARRGPGRRRGGGRGGATAGRCRRRVTRAGRSPSGGCAIAGCMARSRSL